MSFDAKIAGYQKTIDEGKTLLTRLETQAEQLVKEKQQLEQQFKDAGVTPEEAPKILEDLKVEAGILEAEIDGLAAELKTILDSWR